jgi:2'-5' RNA ligase
MSLLVISYPELHKSDYDLIQSWRERYDSEFVNIINPHFTLVFPVENITYESLLTHVQKCSANIKKIPLVINTVKLHKSKIDSNYFLFALPEKGYDEIIKLHDQLYMGILADELRRDMPYLPHITIGVFAGENNCRIAAETINKKTFSIKAELLTLSIIEYNNKQIKLLTNLDLL